MPIPVESKFIQKVLSRTKHQMTTDEIAYLCTLANEDDKFVHASVGAMSQIRLQMGVNEEPPFYVKTVPSTFTKLVTSKYIILTQNRIIAFDDKSGIYFETRKIISYGRFQHHSRTRSQIICETDHNGQYLLLLLRDHDSWEFMDHMNVYREDDDADYGRTRLRDGFEIGKAFELALFADYGFSSEEVHSILVLPEQWDI